MDTWLQYWQHTASARLLLSSLCRLLFEAQNNFYPPTAPQQEALVTGSFNLQDILFYGGCGFSIMRCMSFALENCEKKEGNYTFSDLVKYNFYLPFFFFGPIMTFDRFHAQVRIEIKRNIKINWCFFKKETLIFLLINSRYIYSLINYFINVNN